MTIANITSLHEETQKWLSEQTSDTIHIQEHRMRHAGQFGKIPGYALIFSPARKTLCSERGWQSSGGVAILHRTNMFHRIKHKGIETKGHNWVPLHI